MSSAKYLSVVHEPTGEIVSAYKFENDATWIGKDNDRLIATPIYCKNGARVAMIFIKTYLKKDGKTIYGYFRSTPGEENLRESPVGESNLHKIAKEKIYTGLCSGELTINGKSIDKKLIDDIRVEYRIGNNQCIIPDVIIVFKQPHQKYGLGIFFEIQLSNQTEVKTDERNYQRVIEGLSGIWFFEKHFDESMDLVNKDIVIEPHKKLLMKLEEERKNKFIEEINNYGNIVDKKLIYFKQDIWNYFNSSYKSFQKEVKTYSTHEINNLESESTKLVELKNVASKIDDVLYNTNMNNLTNNINEKVNDGLIFLEDSIKNKTSKLIKESLDKLGNRINRMCPNCNKTMKIGKSMSGYNWYCVDFPIKCGGLIKEVIFNED